MDTIKKQLLDDQRAQDIFPRVRARLANYRLKTNEVYLAILIDEINKYFAELSTSTIDSNDLPSSHNGPISEKHNKLLMNIANDIDKIHGKRIEVQDIITKAANYLSTERVSLNNAVSKMQSRVINQKLRSSMNDRHLIVFTEYFTDDTYVDKKQSKNIEVSKSISALTLTPLTKNEDNSNLIDPTSIYLVADVNNAAFMASAIYPFGQQPNGITTGYFGGFGRTLANDKVDSKLANLHSASSDDEERYANVQSQCFAVGTAGGADAFTHGEFEVIFNDFNSGKVDDTVMKAVKRSVLNDAHLDLDERHIIVDKTEGYSFNGAQQRPNIPTDTKYLKSLIQKMGLRIVLKEGALRGLLSYIRVHFAPPTDVLSIPSINYAKSYIIDADLKQWFPFAEMELNNSTNTISESRFLLLDSIVANPKEIYIDFNLDSLQVVPVKNYTGVCWRVKLHGTDIAGSVMYPSDSTPIKVPLYSSSTTKSIFVYHDIRRTTSAFKAKTLNQPVLNNIISKYRTST